MTESSNAGGNAGDAIKKGVGLVHGAGEVLRGNINALADNAAGTKETSHKNEAVINRGIDEMNNGHYHGTGAGVTPIDADRERTNRAVQGEYPSTGSDYTGPGSTNYGSHNSNMANKMDPRFDSDTDHRGTATGSTNYGPHDTNTGNKLDPRYDSDLDHRGPETSQGLLYDADDLKTWLFKAPVRRDTAPDLGRQPTFAPTDEPYIPDAQSPPSRRLSHPAHSYRMLNALDPRVDATESGKVLPPDRSDTLDFMESARLDRMPLKHEEGLELEAREPGRFDPEVRVHNPYAEKKPFEGSPAIWERGR